MREDIGHAATTRDQISPKGLGVTKEKSVGVYFILRAGKKWLDLIVFSTTDPQDHRTIYSYKI